MLFAVIDGERRRITSRAGADPPGATLASVQLNVPLRRERVVTFGGTG